MGRPLLSEAPTRDSTFCSGDATPSRTVRRSSSTESSSDVEVPFVPDSPTAMASSGRPDPTATILPSLRADIERLRRAAERIRERARQQTGPAETPPVSDSSTLREAVRAIDRAYSELLDAQRNWPPRGSHPWFGDSGTASNTIGPAHAALVLEPSVTVPSNPEPESPPVFRPPRRRLFSRSSPRPTTTVPPESRMSRSPPQSTRDEATTSLARRLQMRGMHFSAPETTQPQVEGARSLLRRMAEVYTGQQHENASSVRRDTIFNLFGVIDVDSPTTPTINNSSSGTSLTRPRPDDAVDTSGTLENDVDPSALRQNRVRRRLNADGDEATVLSTLPEVTSSRPTTATRLRRSRLHDEPSVTRQRRGFRLAGPTGDMDFETSDDILRAASGDSAPPAVPGARRRRGWARIDANGDEILTEDEAELERTRPPAATTTVLAVVPRTLPYLTTRRSDSEMVQDSAPVFSHASGTLPQPIRRGHRRDGSVEADWPSVGIVTSGELVGR